MLSQRRPAGHGQTICKIPDNDVLKTGMSLFCGGNNSGQALASIDLTETQRGRSWVYSASFNIPLQPKSVYCLPRIPLAS